MVLCQEQTGRLNNILSLNFVPLQVSGVALCSHANLLAVHDELAVLNVSLDCALECAVHGVILQHIGQVVNRAKVIDSYNLNVVASLSCAENEAADAAKSVNTNFSHLTFIF